MRNQLFKSIIKYHTTQFICKRYWTLVSFTLNTHELLYSKIRIDLQILNFFWTLLSTFTFAQKYL